MLIVKEDIISRINNGDAKAFEQLYTTFYVYLCAVATKYVYNSEAAREIVNDVFMSMESPFGVNTSGKRLFNSLGT